MSDYRITEAGPGEHGIAAEIRCNLVADAREMAVEDLDAAFVKANAAYIEHGMAAGTYRSWVARDSQNDPVGGIGLALYSQPPLPGEPQTTEGWVIATWVHPDHRSNGLGRRLMVDLEDAARAAGVRRLLLFATTDGRPLYESVGFEQRADLLIKFL